MNRYHPIVRSGFLQCVLLLFLVGIAGCGESGVEGGANAVSNTQGVGVACSVTNVRYPTSLLDFGKLYEDRGFYTDGNHLGRDIALQEGTPVYPIACGSVRVYRSASGYGQLAVVVEHELPHPVTVTNGLGADVSVTNFLTIYGHLRKSADASGGTDLAYRADDPVSANAPIGYVDGDATNGDGGVHLHFGVRLQSVSDAMSTDADWFRGYDDPYVSQRRWFADPALFMDALLKAGLNVRWHPPGTVIERRKDGSRWLLKTDGELLSLSSDVEARDRLSGRAIAVTDAEFGCLGKQAGSALSELGGHRLMKFEDAAAVYEFTGITNRDKRWTFLNAASFTSWGWTFPEVETWAAVLRPEFIQSTADQGYRGLRDGSLVKAKGRSEVAVVSGGQRLPIYDWSTFLALGYRAERIIELDESVLDVTAGSRGPLITPDIVGLCHHPETCIVDCPSQDHGGGGVTDGGTPSGSGGSSGSSAGGSGGQGGSSGNGGTVCYCVPDMQVTCACPGGLEGVQRCASDCRSYDPCVCPVEDAGGGSGGQGGTSGIGGDSGSGGSSGMGGSGGQGGTSGNGGTVCDCVPHAQISCACPGGLQGVQQCASDCHSYEPCLCPVEDAGGGSGGSGGAWPDSGPDAYAGGGSGGSSGFGGAIQVPDASDSGGASGSSGSAGSDASVSPDAGGSGGGAGGSQPDSGTSGKPLHLYYSGPFTGSITVSGWWMPPGIGPVSWHVITECTDTNIADAILDCDLPVPSGASPFDFQVNLPGTKYWGDEACGSGGCGTTLGTVTLTKGGTPVSYTLTPNSAGPPYYNGRVAPVP